MTTAQLARNTAEEAQPESLPGADQRSRISFRQPVSTTGFIDAAWWPRSRDLATELPPLLDVLWTAGREINRITYNLHTWDAAPRHLRIEGRTVRLGGFSTSDPHRVRLSDPWGRERIDIVVIAPETDPDVAHRIFDLASRSGSLCSAQEILDRASGAVTDAPESHS